MGRLPLHLDILMKPFQTVTDQDSSIRMRYYIYKRCGQQCVHNETIKKKSDA